jgi:hypothetical protein
MAAGFGWLVMVDIRVSIYFDAWGEFLLPGQVLSREAA